MGVFSKIESSLNKLVNFGVDQSLPYFELRKAKLLNVIVFSISGILLIFLIMNIAIEQYTLAYWDIALFVFVCIPSWILQYKKKYKANILLITSAFVIYTTIITVLEYDVHRQTEHILPAISIMAIFLFEGWRKNLMFILFPISFFTIRFFVMYDTNGEITFEVLYLIYLLEFLIVYVIASFFKKDMIKFYELLNMSNKTKDKLFRIISHDLRSPFNSLLGMSELQLKYLESKDLDKLEISAKIINSSSNKIYQLTKLLLDWSITQEETFVVKKEDVLIVDLVAEVVSFCEISTREKNVNIFVAPSKLINIVCDRIMTEIAVRNIIMNAVKFSYRDNEVLVSIQENDSEIIIVVKDRGVGMDSDTVETIFKEKLLEPSYGTEKERGSGLGLMISTELIQKQGGRIDVSSKIGEGSEFSIFLPKQ